MTYIFIISTKNYFCACIHAFSHQIGVFYYIIHIFYVFLLHMPYSGEYSSQNRHPYRNTEAPGGPSSNNSFAFLKIQEDALYRSYLVFRFRKLISGFAMRGCRIKRPFFLQEPVYNAFSEIL